MSARAHNRLIMLPDGDMGTKKTNKKNNPNTSAAHHYSVVRPQSYCIMQKIVLSFVRKWDIILLNSPL